MPNIAIICGILLSIIGVAGYIYGAMTGPAPFTALIPFAFGTVLEILGVLAKSNEGARKHLMHAAAVIGLLGFIMPLVRLVPRMSELTMSAAVISQFAMSGVCLVFVVLAVRSFIAARQ